MLILGRLHVKKGIESKYLDVMGPTFCQAIREDCGSITIILILKFKMLDYEEIMLINSKNYIFKELFL